MNVVSYCMRENTFYILLVQFEVTSGFFLAALLANHAATTEAEVLQHISAVIKYAPDNHGGGGRGNDNNNIDDEL